MSADPRLVPDAQVLTEVTYAEAAELAYHGAKVLASQDARAAGREADSGVEQEQLRAGKAGDHASCPPSREATGARAVASMENVALVSLEPASPELNGVQVMARALDAMARANVEVLVVSSSSYRQNFCFLVREEELERTRAGSGAGAGAGIGARLCAPHSAWTTTWGCWRRWAKECRASRALAGRIFTAISRVQVNVIAIAQGSSELTIAVVVRRDGLEKAVRAVHAECGMGLPAPAQSH